MSDNTPAKFLTVWPWHHDEPALYILCKVKANSNLNPTAPFGSSIDYCMTMTTFFEIAVSFPISLLSSWIK